MRSEDPQDVLEIGQLFAGRYAIEGTLGKGGFSRVYAARQLNLDREVALKVFAPRDLQNKEARQRLAKRFMKEAQLLARLSAPHTITLHDYGVTADGELFQVFELIPGTTFKHVVRQSGPLPASRLTPIITQILWSLSEAHAMGLIHRDIKPSNIMVYDHLGQRDRVKVLDFGVAKLVQDYDNAQSEMTADGMILGTPRYMSPEQIIGEPLTPASDLYSLGIVVYEALFMELPYDRDLNLLRRRQQQVTQGVTIPEWFGDATLRRFLERALQGDPTRRYTHAAEALADLEHSPTPHVEDDATLPFIRNGAITSLISEKERHDTAETPENPDTLTSHRKLSTSQAKKRRVLILLAMIIGLVGASVTIALLLVDTPAHDPREEDAIQMATSPAPTQEEDAPLVESTDSEPLPPSDTPPTEAGNSEPQQKEDVETKKVATSRDAPTKADKAPSSKTSSHEPARRADPPPAREPEREEPASESIDLLPTTPKTPAPEQKKKREDDVDLLPTTPKKKSSSGFVIKPLDEQ